MKLLKTQKHSRSLRAVELPTTLDKLTGLPDNLEIHLSYGDAPASATTTEKAVCLDNVVIPAIREAVNVHDALIARLRATRTTIQSYINDDWDGNTEGWSAVVDAITDTLDPGVQES